MVIKTAIIIILVLFSLFALAQEPTTKPSMGAVRLPRHGGTAPRAMATTLPSHFSRKGDLPLTIKLHYINDDKPTLLNSDFQFYLLDESGKSVGESFITEAAIKEIFIEGQDPEYKPRLVFESFNKSIKAGTRYQLITVLITSGLIDSTWFTLEE